MARYSESDFSGTLSIGGLPTGFTIRLKPITLLFGASSGGKHRLAGDTAFLGANG